MNKKTANTIATFFGAGLSAKAPGTAGSLATLPLAFFLCFYFGMLGIVIAAILVFIVGTLATDEIIKNQQDKDPKKVVIDEVAGQLLSFTMVADNLYHNTTYWWVYLFGFGLFRFFDICKMGPVKWCDTNLKNAYGVMLDDVFAGVFAAVTLWFAAQYFHFF